MLDISSGQWGVAFLLYLSAFTVGSSHLSLHPTASTQIYKHNTSKQQTKKDNNTQKHIKASKIFDCLHRRIIASLTPPNSQHTNRFINISTSKQTTHKDTTTQKNLQQNFVNVTKMLYFNVLPSQKPQKIILGGNGPVAQSGPT